MIGQSGTDGCADQVFSRSGINRDTAVLRQLVEDETAGWDGEGGFRWECAANRRAGPDLFWWEEHGLEGRRWEDRRAESEALPGK